MTPLPPLPDGSLPEIDVRVQVSTKYLPQHSSAARQFFAYVVHIENHTPDSWQLLRRVWYITDALDRQTVVEGEGVIGQQPILPPQGVYIYDSLVTLEAAPGRMKGHYILQDAWGHLGRANIATFALQVPGWEHNRVLN